MQDLSFQKAAGLILGEIGGVLAQVGERDAEAFEEAILRANTVFVTGEGRSGLLVRCFAMRLTHLGLQAYVVGETVTPPVSKGDLLVAVSGSGETRTTNLLAQSAAQQGARVAALSSLRDSALARAADLLVLLPAPSKQASSQGSVQYGGTLFEQSILVLLDAVALRLQRRLGETAQQMDTRHATLE